MCSSTKWWNGRHWIPQILRKWKMEIGIWHCSHVLWEGKPVWQSDSSWIKIDSHKSNLPFSSRSFFAVLIRKYSCLLHWVAVYCSQAEVVTMIYRPIYVDKIMAFTDTPFVRILTGVRRCGKSTILKMIIRKDAASGVWPASGYPDNYPKYVLRTDESVGGNYEGIKTMHVADFLLSGEFKTLNTKILIFQSILCIIFLSWQQPHGTIALHPPWHFITADKILISIHHIAMIIWIIKTIRRTGTNSI